jgi:hypothetical protein
VLFDLRTVSPEDDESLAASLIEAVESVRR